MILGPEYVDKTTPPEPWRGIATGATTADLLWGDCEAGTHPLEVSDDGRFYWKIADDLVKPWLLAGVKLTVVVRCKHPQYCRPTIPSPSLFASLQASAPPKDETALKCFARLGAALARRFPGVAWKLDPEATDPTHWLGSASDFVLTYQEFRAAVLGADPTARVVLSAVNFGDRLDDLTGASLDRIIAKLGERATSKAAQDSLAFGIAMLGAATSDDVVSFNQLSGTNANPAGGVDPAARLLRAFAPAAREVWMGDATGAPAAVFDPTLLFQPAPWREMTSTLAALKRGDPAAWARREADQAAMTAAKIEAVRAAGITRAHFCMTRDIGESPWTAAIAWQGLTRADGSLRPACEVIRAAQS